MTDSRGIRTRRRGLEERLGRMDVLAQCGTTAGRGKDGVEGGKGEVGITGVVTIVTLEEAVVKGVSEGKRQAVSGDVGAAARAVSVVTGRGPEAI